MTIGGTKEQGENGRENGKSMKDKEGQKKNPRIKIDKQ